VKKILILQTAFLGDVILATPVISELKRLFPSSEIDVLVRKGNEVLLANNPKINLVHTFDKKNGKLKAIISLIKTFRKNKYDLVLNLHRFGSSGIIAGLSKGEKRYGFAKNPFSFLYTKKFSHEIGNGKHEVERNLSLIKEFGATENLRPELFPSADDFSIADQIAGGTYFCFAPASVWFTKQLPVSKWIELIDYYTQFGTIYLLGGKGDLDFCDEIIQQTQSKMGINLAGQLNLLESAALMKNATRNFVNDSGPLHIASAMNAPVTSFFCSTIPDFGFGPLSEDSEIKQVKEKLDCRPCGLHGHKVCPTSNFECGNKIDLGLSDEA
jgi:ADP-heptose:LPS heptosyltransferase